ncbi:UNVERIFIED_CONTAM: hypothetical protein Cloal_4248 [Acetivibrio alkalicellulosi]
MSRFNLKSLVLGIGIGIVITSFIGLIYSAGLTPQLSRDEIIERAKQFGMVFSEDIIKSE